jgi:hypothetical protein
MSSMSNSSETTTSASLRAVSRSRASYAAREALSLRISHAA